MKRKNIHMYQEKKIHNKENKPVWQKKITIQKVYMNNIRKMKYIYFELTMEKPSSKLVINYEDQCTLIL